MGLESCGEHDLGECIPVRVMNRGLVEGDCYFFTVSRKAAMEKARYCGFNPVGVKEICLEEVPRGGSYDEAVKWAQGHKKTGNLVEDACFVSQERREEYSSVILVTADVNKFKKRRRSK